MNTYTPDSSDAEGEHTRWADGEDSDYVRVQNTSLTRHGPGHDYPIVIALMGVTGSGKSSFIRTVSGSDKVVIGHDLEACTQQVTCFEATVGRQKVLLVDTPGFNDTYRSDTDVLLDISKWLEFTYRKNIKLSGIIYLHRINNPRFEGSARMNLRLFRKLCGTDALKNVLLVTTYWDKEDPTTAARWEKQLTSETGFWGNLIKEGAEYHRFDRSRRQAINLVSILAKRQRTTMAIQDELVNLNLPLGETSAGKAVNEEIERLRKKHEEQMKQLKAHMEEAIRENDRKSMEEIRHDRRENRRKLEILAAQQGRLEREKEDEMRRLDKMWNTRFEQMLATSLQEKKELEERSSRTIAALEERSAKSIEALEEQIHLLRLEQAKGRSSGRPFDWGGAASFVGVLGGILNQVLGWKGS